MPKIDEKKNEVTHTCGTFKKSTFLFLRNICIESLSLVCSEKFAMEFFF